MIFVVANNSANTKRIAKNTLLLYVRMLFMMAVSLYTSRVVLNTLGVEDYGIYNVVGGIVILLSFLNSAMAGATQRYLNVELGRNDITALKKVFGASLLIHFGVAVVVLILAETIGLWFLNNCMNISAVRMDAANWVYQFSVAAFLVSVISVPYNAAIIAHERMSAFAYISILEVVLKLAVVYVLLIVDFDKLKLYAVLIFCVGVLIRFIYGRYCKIHFEECRNVKLKADMNMTRSMLGFSAWTILGNLGFIFHTQGIAILINIFFGATVNAAQGIANQVNGVVKGFVSNFLQALNPQVVKSYASGNIDDMHKLVIRGCQISFLLLAFFAVPLIIETPFILKLWLKTVPEYTVIFVRLVLLLSIFDSFSPLLATAQGATGRIKRYQVTLTLIGLLHVPFSALFFWLGYAPYYAMYVYIVIIIVLQVVRIFFVCNSIGIKKKNFFIQVVCRCLAVLFLSSLLPAFIHLYCKGGFLTTCIAVISGFMSVAVFGLYLGLSRHDRDVIILKVKTKIFS